MDHYVAGVQVGSDAAVRPNGQAVSAQFDGSLDLAIDVKVFAAGKLSLDEHRLAYMTNFLGRFHSCLLGRLVVAGEFGCTGRRIVFFSLPHTSPRDRWAALRISVELRFYPRAAGFEWHRFRQPGY